MKKWDEGFYHGVLSCMAVLAADDWPSIAQEIVRTIDRKKLFLCADEHDKKNLAELGIKP